jgi:hypothetical protein
MLDSFGGFEVLHVVEHGLGDAGWFGDLTPAEVETFCGLADRVIARLDRASAAPGDVLAE